jgi:phage-related protein
MDGNKKIVIKTKIDTKQAEADLKALKSSIRDTAKELSSVEKQITQANSHRSKLADDLKSAQAAAQATRKAIQDLDAKMTAGKEFDALAAKSEELSTTYEHQDNKLKQLQQDYKAYRKAQETSKAAFTPEQAAASAQVGQNYQHRIAAAQAELNATAQKLDALGAQMDALHQRGVTGYDAKDLQQQNLLTQKLEKQQATAEQAQKAYDAQGAALEGLKQKHETLAGLMQQEETAAQNLASTIQQAAVSPGMESVGKSAASTASRVTRASKAVTYFGRRMREIVTGALVFNLISSGLRSVTNTMGSAIMQTNGFKAALAQLKGAAATCVAPLVSALGSALTFIINLLATALGYLAQLISLLTGKSISAMKAQAKALNKTGSAAAKATKSLAAFDEINRLQDNSSGGGGGGVGFDTSGIGQLPSWLKKLAEEFGAGFKKGFGDAAQGLANIKADLAQIGADLKDIWQDPAVHAAVKRFASTAVFALGEIVGAAASIGVSVAENLVGGFAQYLNRSKDFLKKILPNILNMGSDLMALLGDTVAAIATVFRSLGSEGAKQLTSGFIGILANSALGIIQTVEQVAYAIAKPLLQPFIDNAEKIRDVFANLAAVVAPFFVGVSDGFAVFFAAMGDFYNAVLNPIIDGFAALNSELLGDFLDTINRVLESLTGTKDVLHSVGEVVGFVIAAVLTGLTVIKTVTTALGAAKLVITGLHGAFTLVSGVISGFPALLGAILSPAGLVVAAIAAAIAAGVLLYQNWDTIKTKCAELIAAIQQGWNEFCTRFLQLVSNFCTKTKQDLQNWCSAVLQFWLNAANKVVSTTQNMAAKAKALWQTLCTGVRNLVSGFVSTVGSAMNGLRNLFSSIWSAITRIVGDAITNIINGVLSMVERIANAISGILSALSSMHSRVSDGISSAQSAIGGAAVYSAPLTDLPVPALARGAVIPANREFLAVLGDQSHGTNVEAPLDTIKQAVAEVMEDLQAGQMAGFEAVVSVLREILSAVYGIELTDEDVGHAVQRWQRKQLTATGGV